jgi:large subunit ribosomal protein L35
MNKVKTKKSLTNRLKITKNGKVLRRQSFRRHLKASKSSKQLRNLKRTINVTGYLARKVRKVVGNRTTKKMRDVANKKQTGK